MDSLFSKSLLGLLMVGVIASAPVSAAIQAPYVNIQDQMADAGTISNAGNLTIDATALSISILAGSNIPISSSFSLAGQFSGISNTSYTFNNGTLSIGTMLSATFDSLSITPLGSDAVISANLNYVSGNSIMGLTSGRLEGTLIGVSGLIDSDFTVLDTFVSVGEISPVPIPATLWMFMPMLAGLFGMGYRNNNK